MRSSDGPRLGTSVLLVVSLRAPVAAQQRYHNPTLDRQALLRLTFERTLRSAQKTTCTFKRPSTATAFDNQGFLVEVAPDVPRYLTVDGDTGVVIEGPRVNYCANSSFETSLSGWTTAGLTAARSAAARLHGSYGLQLTNKDRK